jgi:hypothetical protein
MRKFLWAALVATMLVPAVPASASNTEGASQEHGDDHDDRHDKHWKNQQKNGRDYRAQRLRAENRRDNRAYNRQIERQYDRQRRNRQQAKISWQNYNRYDYNRPDPRYGTYYAERYYRDSSYYQPYTLSRNDRIYRGSDRRYYCRRNDGTTGLIIGALGGGFLGDAIAPRGSKTLGAILGGTTGALVGRSIGRDGVRCQ